MQVSDLEPADVQGLVPKNIHEKRFGWDRIYMTFARGLAEARSTCAKVRTACFIVDPETHQPLSIGYNGAPSQSDHCFDYFSRRYKSENPDVPFDKWMRQDHMQHIHADWSCHLESHAEINALARPNRPNTKGATLYTVLAPCSACSHAIIGAGIKRVVCQFQYGRDPHGVVNLRKSGIRVDFMSVMC